MWWILGFLAALYLLYSRRKKKLVDVYGKGWAIIAGASEGLGQEFAETLASKGYNLILIARRANVLNDLSSKIQDTYLVSVKTIPLDLAKFDDLKQVMREIESLDVAIAVYNAAYSPIGSFLDRSIEELEKVTRVNCVAPLCFVQSLLPQMLKRKHKSAVILMSSLSGNQGTPNVVAYAASKAFNTILAEGLWFELKEKGVDVIASVAGAISTPGLLNSSKNLPPPGTVTPRRVVSETLNALGSPTVIPGVLNNVADLVLRRLLPRSWGIHIMAMNTKALE
jgi:short-subunit dehydrogenase